MSRPPEPLFVERRTYRRRRLADAATFLPIVGLILLLLPIVWHESADTRSGLIYIFAIWAILIVVVAPISARLSARMRESESARTRDIDARETRERDGRG